MNYGQIKLYRASWAPVKTALINLGGFTDEEADLTQVARLMAWLYQLGDTWATARQLSTDLDLTERQIRHLAASSHGQIVSSPGSRLQAHPPL